METILEVLMKRDGLTYEQAVAEINVARRLVADGEDPEEVLQEEFGLEPDYFWDLL